MRFVCTTNPPNSFTSRQLAPSPATSVLLLKKLNLTNLLAPYVLSAGSLSFIFPPIIFSAPDRQPLASSGFSIRGLYGVIAGPMAHVIACRRRHTDDFDIDFPEIRKRRTLRRIVRQQILRAQFVADFVKCLVQLCDGGSVVVFPSRVLC